MDEPTFQPGQAAEILQIPPSTLRTYATEFAPLLSVGARGKPGDPNVAFGHRHYTVADLAVLKRVKALLDDGASYRVTRAQLGGGVSTPDRARRLPRPGGHPRLGPGRARSPRQVENDRVRPPFPTTSAAEPSIPETLSTPDPTSLAAVEQLTGLATHLRAVGQVVAAQQELAEGLQDQLARVERQLQRIDSDLQALVALATRPPKRENWLTRWFQRGRPRGDASGAANPGDPGEAI